MKIDSIKEVNAILVSSNKMKSYRGLHCIATYECVELPFTYTVEFYSNYAPNRILADIVGANVAGDAPMIVTDGNGNLLRDENGQVKVTRTVVVMCPKKPNGQYYNGHNPELVIQRYINRFLIPTVWGRDNRIFIINKN